MDRFLEKHPEPWARRLLLPAYSLVESARYAGISPDTTQNWYYSGGALGPALPGKEHGKPLSYLELVELAMVAAFRRQNVSLQSIRKARSYAQQVLEEEFPFATERWKTDGFHLVLTLQDYEPNADLSHLIIADAAGQLAWESVIATKFFDFDYISGLALTWHVAGRDSKVIIDPRLAFGAPTIAGVPTRIIHGRLMSGETRDEIAQDFDVSSKVVDEALEFEQDAIAA